MLFVSIFCWYMVGAPIGRPLKHKNKILFTAYNHVGDDPCVGPETYVKTPLTENIFVGSRHAVTAVERIFLHFICRKNNVNDKQFPADLTRMLRGHGTPCPYLNIN